MCLSCYISDFLCTEGVCRARGDFVRKHASGRVVVKGCAPPCLHSPPCLPAIDPEVPEVDWSEFSLHRGPSAWPTYHQPFTVSCLTCGAQVIGHSQFKGREWDSGTETSEVTLLFRKVCIIKCLNFSLPELSRNIISQHVLWEPGWQLISVGHLLTYPGFLWSQENSLFPTGRQSEISTYSLLRRSHKLCNLGSRRGQF